MGSRTRETKAYALTIIVSLGVLVFTASGAQAQLPGESKLGHYLINLGAALPAQLWGEIEGISSLLVKGRNLTIDCEFGEITSANIISLTEASGTVLVKKCVAWNFALTEALPCTVLSPGEPTSSINGAAISLPILHGGKNFVLIEPTVAGGNLTTIELHGSECPLPLVNPLKGSFVVEITTNHASVILGSSNEAIQLLGGTKLLFGTFPAYIDARAQVGLGPTHAGTLTVE